MSDDPITTTDRPPNQHPPYTTRSPRGGLGSRGRPDEALDLARRGSPRAPTEGESVTQNVDSATKRLRDRVAIIALLPETTFSGVGRVDTDDGMTVGSSSGVLLTVEERDDLVDHLDQALDALTLLYVGHCIDATQDRVDLLPFEEWIARLADQERELVRQTRAVR